MTSYIGEKIWIIGASSGIGAALAKALTLRGARVLLSARSEEAICKLAEQLGDKHHYLTMDVADIEKIPESIEEAYARLGSFDRVIFLAAVYEPTSINQMDVQSMQLAFQINVCAPMALVNGVIPYLTNKGQPQKHQIVLFTSPSGWMGLPNAQPYAATKAALINFTESLNLELGDKINVKLVNPGFVDTRLTRKNRFPMPCIVTADKAAEYIVKGLQANGFEIHFPKRFTLLMKMVSMLPFRLKYRLLKRLN